MVAKLAMAKIKGIVPIYKKAGISYYTLLDWVQLHIAYEFPMDKYWFKPYVESYRSMEPFASGVLTIGIGRPSFYVKYLQFCDSRYIVDLRMGQSTVTDYFQSLLVKSKPFDHIKLDDVKKACQSFIGTQIQVKPKVVFLRPLGISDEEDEVDNQMDKKVKSMENFLSLDNQMRHVVGDHIYHRQVTCHSIEITKFEPPNLTLEINCSVPFSIRTFVHDLFNKLDTCGSFVRLHRIQEGPFTLDQCIDQTDLYLKYLKPALCAHTEPFVDHVRQHLDKLPFFKDNRLGKNR